MAAMAAGGSNGSNDGSDGGWRQQWQQRWQQWRLSGSSGSNNAATMQCCWDRGIARQRHLHSQPKASCCDFAACMPKTGYAFDVLQIGLWFVRVQWRAFTYWMPEFSICSLAGVLAWQGWVDVMPKVRIAAGVQGTNVRWSVC
jgi:hypothetical protein